MAAAVEAVVVTVAVTAAVATVVVTAVTVPVAMEERVAIMAIMGLLAMTVTVMEALGAAMLTMVAWPGTKARAMPMTTTMTMVEWSGIEAQAMRVTTTMTTTRITPQMQPGKPQKTPGTLPGKLRKTGALPEMTLM